MCKRKLVKPEVKRKCRPAATLVLASERLGAQCGSVSAKINAGDKYGIIPLHIAVESEKMEIIELLVNQGVDVNTTNDDNITPLHLALKRYSEGIIKFLLSRVANADANWKDGRTYIDITAKRGCLQIGEHLLKRGANVNSANTFIYREGYTPLCLAVKD
jgi:ankyrin repeat protein